MEKAGHDFQPLREKHAVIARPLRIEVENGLYHVTCRGWERREIARDDADRESWLELLDRLAALWLCRRLTDERVASLAARFGGASSAAITKAVARSENRRLTDRRWDHRVSQLEAQIRF